MGLLSSLGSQGQRTRGGGGGDGERRARGATRPGGREGDGAGSFRGTDGTDGTASESSSVVLTELERMFVQVFALVGEAIAGATHALLACDRDAAKQLMARDDLVDDAIAEITSLAQDQLVAGPTTEQERRELVTLLRMLPDLDRNGDLAEHVARRAARGLGAEMSPRSRGLVERMGEIAAAIWASAGDALADRSVHAAGIVDALDDELDDLHVSLTAELATGTMPVPVAIELAMVARFYERFGDHAVSLARRMAALASTGAELGGPTAADARSVASPDEQLGDLHRVQRGPLP